MDSECASLHHAARRRTDKHYGSILALADVSSSIRLGEILGLIGPNAAGKTTLFECMAGVLSSDAGSVLINGQAIGPRRWSSVRTGDFKDYVVRSR